MYYLNVAKMRVFDWNSGVLVKALQCYTYNKYIGFCSFCSTFSSENAANESDTFLLFFSLPEELLAYEVKRKEAEENMRPPPEPVRARIPFTACLQAFTEPENVPDFWSSALQAKSAGVK